MKHSKTYTEKELQDMPYEQIEEKVVPVIENWGHKRKRYFSPNSLKQLAIHEYLKSNPKVDDKVAKRDIDQPPVGGNHKSNNQGS